MTAARAPEPAPDIPIAAADALRACLWVAIGSCIRGHLLFLLGLPLVVAGFAVAPRGTGDGPCRGHRRGHLAPSRHPDCRPDPNIDVWIWTQTCIQALLRGVHPYTVDARDLITNVYYLGPTAAVYPYMPLTLLAFAPAYALFGDYRVLSAYAFPPRLR